MLQPEMFMARLTTLAEIFGKTLSEPTLQAYYEACQRFPMPDLILQAMVDLRAAEYMPRPWDILERARKLRLDWEAQPALPAGQITEADREAGRLALIEIRKNLAPLLQGRALGL